MRMSEAKNIDVRGLACPEPALMTQQALASLSGGALRVLVDSGTARDNVARTARHAGWKVTEEEMPDWSYKLTLTK
jgi:tRNA 2-thiouridine synthesizing protein A